MAESTKLLLLGGINKIMQFWMADRQCGEEPPTIVPQLRIEMKILVILLYSFSVVIVFVDVFPSLD